MKYIIIVILDILLCSMILSYSLATMTTLFIFLRYPICSFPISLANNFIYPNDSSTAQALHPQGYSLKN